MRVKAMLAANDAAKEFLRRLEVALGAWGDSNLPEGSFPKEFGALRRQSMELTRALAEFRKP